MADLIDVALVKVPAGKVPVGIHAGEPVDQRPPGEMEVFNFNVREQALLLGLGQEPHTFRLDRLTLSVPGRGSRSVEKSPVGNHLEMRWIANGPANPSLADRAEAHERILLPSFFQRSRNLILKPRHRLFRDRCHEGGSIREVPKRSAGRNAGEHRHLSHRHVFRPHFFDQPKRRIDQHLPEISMVITGFRGT